jgi:hypothetical protein
VTTSLDTGHTPHYRGGVTVRRLKEMLEKATRFIDPGAQPYTKDLLSRSGAYITVPDDWGWPSIEYVYVPASPPHSSHRKHKM